MEFSLEYINKKKEIQQKLLEFLDRGEDIEENFINLVNLFKDQKITINPHDLKSVLHLLLAIISNHHRWPDFLSKIEQIFQYLKDDIKKHFTNFEIFDFFKSNNAILLILFQQKILFIDKYVFQQMKLKQSNYLVFFSPEIKIFLESDDSLKNEEKDIYEKLNKKENPTDFFENRKIGENINDICKIIREDLIEEFIIYINKNECSLNLTIPSSFYETNSLLLKRPSSLIQYAAFFGSIQIFKYLFLNGADFTSSLWTYAIHGENEEMIKILEESKKNSKIEDFLMCYKKAIKFHHNSTANYIKNNFLDGKIQINSIESYFKYYNYNFLYDNFNNDDDQMFYYLCKYDYFTLVEHLMKTKEIDLKAKNIKKKFQNLFFFN